MIQCMGRVAFRRDFRSITCSFGYILLPQIFQLFTYLNNCYNILCLFIFFEYILNLDCSCLWNKQNNTHILFCLFHKDEQYGIYLLIQSRPRTFYFSCSIWCTMSGVATRCRSNWTLEDRFYISARSCTTNNIYLL